MNKKDREALDKFMDEDSLSSEDTQIFKQMSDGERATFIAERFFEAGAKHGRSQLNELRDDNIKDLYSIINSLQKENNELLLDNYKKAEEVNRLNKEIQELNNYISRIK